MIALAAYPRLLVSQCAPKYPTNVTLTKLHWHLIVDAKKMGMDILLQEIQHVVYDL